MKNWIANLILMAAITPCAWLSVIPAAFLSPYWLLVGLGGLVSRMLLSNSLYLAHSASNAAGAAEYTGTLRKKGYRGALNTFEELFPTLSGRYKSQSKIYIKISKPSPGDPPLSHYCAFTMPAHRVAIVFIGDEPDKLGGILYLQALHEIGHALFSGQVHTLNRLGSLTQVWIIYFPIALMVYWWPFQLCVLLVAIWHYRLEHGADFAEISADKFAIQAFDETRDVAARENAVSALIRHWKQNLNAERVQRTDHLNNGIGYEPSIGSVKKVDWFRYSGRTKEISVDQTGLKNLRGVNTGPISVAAILVVTFCVLGIGESFSLPSSEIALKSLIVFIPFGLATLGGTVWAYWHANRQVTNIAWILATGENEHLLDEIVAAANKSN